MTIKNKAAFAGVLALGVSSSSTMLPAGADDNPPVPYGTSLSMNGAVGLPLNPTALLPPPGRVPLQLNYYDLGDADIDGIRPRSFRQYGVYGAYRYKTSPLELSAGLETLDVNKGDGLFTNLADRSGGAVGAKYQFFQSRDGDTAMAIGAGFSRVGAENLYAYLVGSHAFRLGGVDRVPALAHLGVRYDHFDVDRVAPWADESDRISAYGGLEIPIDRNGQWTAVGEIQSRNNDYRRSYFSNIDSGEARYPYSVGLRYRTLDQRFSAMAGIQRRGYPGLTNQSGLFVQAGYLLGNEPQAPRIPLTLQAPPDIEACATEDVVAKVRSLMPVYRGGLAPYSWDAARSDGLRWTDPYSPGVTTIEWRVTDSAGDTLTAKSTVTVVGIEIVDLLSRRVLVPHDQSTLEFGRDELIRASTGFPRTQLSYNLRMNGADTNADRIVLNIGDLKAEQTRDYQLDWSVALAGSECPPATYRQTISVEKTAEPIREVRLITFDAVACAHGMADSANVAIKPARTNPADIPLTWTRSDGATSLHAPYPIGNTTITWTANAFDKTWTATSQVTVYKLELAEPVNMTYTLDWPHREYSRQIMRPTATWITPEGRTTVAARAYLRDGTEIPTDAPYRFPLGTTVVTWKAQQMMGEHHCEETKTQLITVNRNKMVVECPTDVDGWNCEGQRAVADITPPRAKDGRPVRITMKRSDDADGAKGLTWSDPFPIGATIVKWFVVDATEPGGTPHECKTVVRVRSAKMRWTSTPRNIIRTVYDCQTLRLTAAAIGKPAAVTNYPQDGTRVTNIVGRVNGKEITNGFDFPCGKTTIVNWVATNELGCTLEWNQKVQVVEKKCPGTPMPRVVEDNTPAQSDYYDK